LKIPANKSAKYYGRRITSRKCTDKHNVI